MSDGLVKRLREGDNFEKVMSAGEAADRIEELEAEISTVKKSLTVAQAKLAKAVEALGKALERLEASLFTNSEHAQAAETIRSALTEQETHQ